MAGLSSTCSIDSLSYKEMSYRQEGIDYFPPFPHVPMPQDTSGVKLDWEDDKGSLHPTSREMKAANQALGKIAAKDSDVKALREEQALTLLVME